jgi:hypothetical protein
LNIKISSLPLKHSGTPAAKRSGVGRWHEVPDEVFYNNLSPHQSAPQTASPRGEALKKLMDVTFLEETKKIT